MSTTTTQWETEVVTAWGEEPDCAPSTGMCDACGLGATIVEIDETGTTSVRSTSVGAGGGVAPFNYDDATFEIASYTKHFTALAMSILEAEKVIVASATVRDFLPCHWEAASHDGVAAITLEELRLHTSGLPPQAPNHDLAGQGEGNPFGGYTETMLCDSLLALTGLPSRGRFVYSNYGYGALGYALTIAAAKPGLPPPSYEDLVKGTVLLHLGMNDTSVTLDEAGWEKAAVGCDRGVRRGEYAIRRGPYGVLQGNGALRSTLPDMAKFLEASLCIQGGFETNCAGNFTPKQRQLYETVQVMDNERSNQKEACTCVSGWCEGNLCPLPNPVKERIREDGITIYTSGGVTGSRKSGDTEGYSVRGSWSFMKRRAVFVLDTCGGCGERGTSGSAAQRVALLLADGPPLPAGPVCGLEEGASDQVYRFIGKADSHVYPSFVDLEVEVRRGSRGTATVAVASSDGAGCTTAARPTDLGWDFDTSVLYGCGWGGDDPLAAVSQKRSLRLLSDGSGAILQEMGEDIYLTLAANSAVPIGMSKPSTAHPAFAEGSPLFSFLIVAVLFLV